MAWLEELLRRPLRRNPERILYRILRGGKPTKRDFQSDAELGREPRGDQVKDRRQYDGISMFDSLSDTANMARRFGLGSHIAELRISQDHPDIRIHKTRGPHHYSVVGDADTLRQLVITTYPV